ncbi:galactosylgalactosylxylosylprotein 3-beta-glucuronosyltransferase 3-like isoform X2 [Mya arenaria]|uniref:galactosylgalactosylxylosylprotein 3-beta-glucuronosyltransferase 3-like isoform X2 n=1 Tax=Mya arenaria TaxID=6604 RepID=UPI0022E7D414|nr:galactosylgalactosylxylosylprotein 3-beta-glucuronosyltransferase 3-like isoform X2 [Mya arenaria]
MIKRNLTRLFIVGIFLICLTLFVTKGSLFCNIFVPNEYTKERECQTLHVRKDIPRIYIVTPTHTRLTQKADLTRLSYTLRLVPNIRWIVVEDADQPSDIVKNLLANSELHYTHLFAKTRTESLKKAARRNHRGVNQRNEAISWIRRNAQHPGVVYFADDDNTYAIRVFEEVVGWHTSFRRKISTDMAGFAVSLHMLEDHARAQFRATAASGYLEVDFIQQLGVTLSDLEPRADDCTKVLVWHTKTEKPSIKNEALILKWYNYTSDPNIEV